MSLNDEEFVWKLYTDYVHCYMNKSKNKKIHLLMKPGLFCEYFAIKLHQKISDGYPKIMDTFEKIIDELAIPNCIFSNHPAGPLNFQEIYRDDYGDLLDIYTWK